MPLPTGLRALASRDFRVYFAGTLVSQICNWMQSVTQSADLPVEKPTEFELVINLRTRKVTDF